ncbi:MAG TPA: alpha/beta fold hydrolase [Acidimicrobiales bacterium]
MRTVGGFEYEVRGEGEAVLLIHGSVIADAFMPLSREASLAQGRRVIWHRRRGYGRSEPVAGSVSLDDQTRDAVALLDELGVERAHVVGHSFGGAIAIRLALQVPELVHSLVLLEPAVFTFEEATAVDFIEPLIDIYRSGEPGKAVHLFMKGAGGAAWRTEIEERIRGAGQMAELDAAGVFEGDLPSLLEHLYGPGDRGRLNQPVLYITGSQSLPQGMAVTHLLARAVETAVIQGVNHSLQMVAPGPIADAVTRFLDRHPIPPMA